jgi:phage head maturation protease
MARLFSFGVRGNGGKRQLTKERDEERRSIPFAPEMRSAEGSRVIGGMAAVFDTPSRDLGGFQEIVTNSAFNQSRALGYPDVVCRVDHRDIIGSIRGKTLTLNPDAAGLGYECDVAETRAGDDCLALIR